MKPMTPEDQCEAVRILKYLCTKAIRLGKHGNATDIEKVWIATARAQRLLNKLKEAP